jgi:glycerophosphoryl diester phosphodiesterase
MASRRSVVQGAAGLTALLACGAAAPDGPRRGLKAEVFGHRGACALRPEHTLASYALAVADGADYVEPDLVITKDGVLVARHENNIAETTDVATRPEFAGRRATKTVDGEATTGWFTEDFTLAELKTLRAIERIPKVRPENTVYNGEFQIPTFEEYLDFIAAESALRGRLIGLVPEIKHSTYFASIGLPMEDRFLATLAAHSYARRAPVEIQSFEIANLRYIRSKLGHPSNVRLMQLVDTGDAKPADVAAKGGSLTFAQMTAPAGLADIATYADVVAPPKPAILESGAEKRLGGTTTLVADAHRAGLLVHVWTFRPENVFLPADFQDDAGENTRNPHGSIAEIRRYLDAGIDGFFTDDPALGREAVG